MSERSSASDSTAADAAAAFGPLAADELGASLYASAPAPLPFGRSLQIRAYLLRREAGNLIVYSVPGLGAHATAVDELGGVERQYLGHRHEAMFAAERLPVPLHVHERDRDAVAEHVRVEQTFAERHRLDGDFEVIPIPGHTPGATAYLWRTGAHRLLFTGDTLFVRDGEWEVAVLGSSDPDRYLDSVELIRELDFDVLVPWVATAGQQPYAHTDGRDARRRLDRLLERLRRR